MTGREDGFTVDAERLGDRAGDFDPLARRVERVVAELTRTLDAVPAPWGDDEVGQGFADRHVAPAARAREVLEGLPGELDGLGSAFADAAGAYRAAEDEAADTVHDAGRAE